MRTSFLLNILLIVPFLTIQLNACQLPSDPYKMEYPEKICSIIEAFKKQKNYGQSLLLYGPQGSNKDFLPELMAQEAESVAVIIDGDNFLNESPAKLRALLDEHKRMAEQNNQKLMFIFKNMDNLGQKITLESYNSNYFRNINLQTVYNALEEEEDNKNLYFVFIVDKLYNLEPAFLSRIASTKEIPAPNVDNRKYILKMLLIKNGMQNDYHDKRLNEYARATEEFNVHAMEEIFNKCKQKAELDGKPTLSCIETEVKLSGLKATAFLSEIIDF